MMPRKNVSSNATPVNLHDLCSRRTRVVLLLLFTFLCAPVYVLAGGKSPGNADEALAAAAAGEPAPPVAQAPDEPTTATSPNPRPVKKPDTLKGDSSIVPNIADNAQAGTPPNMDSPSQEGEVPAESRTSASAATPDEEVAATSERPHDLQPNDAVKVSVGHLKPQIFLTMITSTLSLAVLVALLLVLTMTKLLGRKAQESAGTLDSLAHLRHRGGNEEHRELSRQLDRTSARFNEFDKALKDANAHLRQIATMMPVARPSASPTAPDSYLKSDVEVLQKLYVLSSNIRGSNMSAEDYARKVFGIIANTKKEAGIYLITPNQGDPFDVNLHEGTPVPNESVPKGRIVRLLSPGLRVADHVVEFAKVAYAK